MNSTEDNTSPTSTTDVELCMSLGDVSHDDDDSDTPNDLSSQTTPRASVTPHSVLEEDESESGGSEEGELNERAAKAYLFQVTSVSDNAPDRQIAIRCILNVVENCKHGDEQDEQQVSDLFNLIKHKFAVDSDPLVRAELLEVLPALCLHCCHQAPWFEPYVHDTLLPLLPRFLNDQNTQVRKTCQAAIVILLEQKLLQADFLQSSICPVLISLSEDFRSEDVRVEAVSLLCKIISQALSRENAVCHFLPKFTSLCQDSLFHIRKVCASSIGSLSRLLGTSMTERVLVPHLISLSQDSVWGVRKACAEVFTDVSNQCSMNIRRTQLASVFIVLLADTSRWVQSAAFQSLGPFISTFADANRTGLKWNDGRLIYEQPTDADEEAYEDGEHEYLQLPHDVIVPPISPPNAPGSASPHHDDDFMGDLDALIDDPHDSMCTPDSDTSASSVQLTPSSRLELDDELQCQDAPEKVAFSPIEDEFASFRFWQLPLGADDENDKGNGSQLTSPEQDQSLHAFMARHFSKEENGKPRPELEDTAVTQPHSVTEPTNNEILDIGYMKSAEDIINAKHVIDSDNDTDSDDDPLIFSVPTNSSSTTHNKSNGQDKEFHYQDIIPQPLLDNFVSMVEPYRAQTVESDISRHCAFNLPAVALTMGRQHWHHLKPTYLSLANDMQWKVRRTLAFSIHELAAILGHDITVADLLPVFQSFVRDLDEVRIGVLKHLHDFIKLLDMPTRKFLLLSMADFLQTDNIRNWRFRLLLAEQLVLLCELYAIEDVNEYLSPIAMTLAIDKVSVIRKATYLLLAKTLGYFYDVEKNLNRSSTMDITNSFTQDIIKGFACSQRWARRQTFVYTFLEILRAGILPDEEICKELLPALLRLAHDRIPNVRISLAQVLSSQESRLINCPGVAQAIDTLIKDVDTDCRYVLCKDTANCIKGEAKSPRNISEEPQFQMELGNCEDNLTELKDELEGMGLDEYVVSSDKVHLSSDPLKPVKWKAGKED